MRPRIAVNCDIQEQEKPRAFLYLDYLDWIARAGAVPVVIPPVEGAEELLDDCDGLLLTGGDDYRAANVNGEPPHFVPIAARREAFDFALARRAKELGRPTVGVCAGFQLLVLAEGGDLYGDIGAELKESRRHRRDSPTDPMPWHDVLWDDVHGPMLLALRGLWD